MQRLNKISDTNVQIEICADSIGVLIDDLSEYFDSDAKTKEDVMVIMHYFKNMKIRVDMVYDYLHKLREAVKSIYELTEKEEAAA